MEGFFEIVAIAFGRYMFGVIGKYSLLCWKYLFGKSKVPRGEDWGFGKVVDTNDFKDRVRGVFVILILIILVKGAMRMS
jgi:hypothetical protein